MSLVLVTGSAGRIGQAVVKELAAHGHAVRGFDLATTPYISDSVVGSLTDPVAVAKAMTGVSTLIHLAATPDDDDFMTRLLPNNIIGVYHVFEAARQAGVSRMILASTGQVMWARRLAGPWPVRVTDLPTPRYWYAAGKMFLEGAGFAFSDAHAMEVIVVRLGWCPRTREQVHEIASAEWAQDVYLSPNDAGRFFRCAVEARLDQRYVVVYATSKPLKVMRNDLEPARRLLGYEPHESWPMGTEIVLGTTAAPIL